MMPISNANSTEPIKRRLVPLREAAMAISVAPRRLAALARAGVVPRVEVSTRLHLYDVDAVVTALKNHNP